MFVHYDGTAPCRYLPYCRYCTEMPAHNKKRSSHVKKLYDTYAGIVDTYKKISKGDYISNLVEAKKCEDEQKMQNTKNYDDRLHISANVYKKILEFKS